MGLAADSLGQIVLPKPLKMSLLHCLPFMSLKVPDEKFWHTVCMKEGIFQQPLKIPAGQALWRKAMGREGEAVHV